VIGSRITIASSIARLVVLGRCANEVRRLPSGVFGPNVVRTFLISSPTVFHCSVSEPSTS